MDKSRMLYFSLRYVSNEQLFLTPLDQCQQIMGVNFADVSAQRCALPVSCPTSRDTKCTCQEEVLNTDLLRCLNTNRKPRIVGVNKGLFICLALNTCSRPSVFFVPANTWEPRCCPTIR